MAIADEIKYLSKLKKVSMASLARSIGISPSNFHQKLNRGTLKYSEYRTIVKTLGFSIIIEDNVSKIDTDIFTTKES